jgi:hypothetical protein
MAGPSFVAPAYRGSGNRLECDIEHLHTGTIAGMPASPPDAMMQIHLQTILSLPHLTHTGTDLSNDCPSLRQHIIRSPAVHLLKGQKHVITICH